MFVNYHQCYFINKRTLSLTFINVLLQHVPARRSWEAVFQNSCHKNNKFNKQRKKRKQSHNANINIFESHVNSNTTRGGLWTRTLTHTHHQRVSNEHLWSATTFWETPFLKHSPNKNHWLRKTRIFNTWIQPLRIFQPKVSEKKEEQQRGQLTGLCRHLNGLNVAAETSSSGSTLWFWVLPVSSPIKPTFNEVTK